MPNVTGLRLESALRGSLRKRLQAEERAGEKAVTESIRRRTNALKANIRRQIIRAGLGERLANTVRSATYPERGESLGAKGVVWDISRVGKKRGTGRFADLIRVFDEGAVIRPAQGRRFLAIPTAIVGRTSRGRKGGTVRKTPQDYPEGRLVLLRSKRGGLYLLDSETGVPAFWLASNVRIRKRIDIAKDVRKAERGLATLITNNWDRRMRRIEAQF